MREWIRRLSWKVEFAIVLGLAFGWTLPGTLRALVTAAVVARSSTPALSDIRLCSTILLELIMLGLLVPLLRARGWTLARLGIRPSFRGCLQGCALALVAYVLYVGFAVMIGGSWPEVARALAATRLLGGGLSWTTVIVASVINPFYEEIFVCGYVISVLAEPRAGAAQAVSLAMAVNVSALIRLSYHLYQGVAGVLAVVPLGLLFALWFARTRQLWPLIVAHAILDFVALARGVG